MANRWHGMWSCMFILAKDEYYFSVNCSFIINIFQFIFALQEEFVCTVVTMTKTKIASVVRLKKNCMEIKSNVNQTRRKNWNRTQLHMWWLQQIIWLSVRFGSPQDGKFMMVFVRSHVTRVKTHLLTQHYFLNRSGFSTFQIENPGETRAFFFFS